MPKSASTYHLRLKEGCEVRLRPHLSGHPCGMHPILRAVGPGQRTVHNRIVLPDAKMPQGPLARVTGAALPVADRAHHCLAFLCATLTGSTSCAYLRSLNQTSKSSHSSPSLLGPLKEPCQHACLKHPYRALGPKPFLSGNPTVQRPHPQEDAGVLPTISSSEESRMIHKHLPASRL